MGYWKPEESDRQYTPLELAANWLYYHIWPILIFAGIALIIGSWIYSAATNQPPDYQIAYVGESPLPTSAEAAMKSLFLSLGEDLNGDGEVEVVIKSYNASSNPGLAPQMAAAAVVGLLTDVQSQESHFFLLEDPAAFQQQYQVLTMVDGTVPDEEDRSAEGKVYALRDCPILETQEMDELARYALNQLYLGRRYYWGDPPENLAAWEQLWAALTAGAVPPDSQPAPAVPEA